MSFDHLTPLTLSVIPPVCSQEQCAVFLGVTKDTIRGFVETDALPTVKIGRQRFINFQKLLSDLQAGKTQFTRGDYE
ncbi:hypothetical protein [Cellvibrio sp.]|uniref:hypothetical protein n=1 Tax=Cellvibrio sp. TaxID=1965322 RepID=UPI00396485E1